MKKIIVLAGTREQFEYYVRVTKLGDKAVYGCDFIRIHGVEAEKVETIGTFWDRKDASDLKKLADTRIR